MFEEMKRTCEWRKNSKYTSFLYSNLFIVLSSKNWRSREVKVSFEEDILHPFFPVKKEVTKIVSETKKKKQKKYSFGSTNLQVILIYNYGHAIRSFFLTSAKGNDFFFARFEAIFGIWLMMTNMRAISTYTMSGWTLILCDRKEVRMPPG